MKVTLAGNESSTQAAADRTQFVLRDFLKMLTAAILCGIAVSIAAAGVTLLLSGSVEAREPAGETADVSGENPGMLIVGDGCDGRELGAADRDWYVRVDGKTIDVRVMQTWIMPADAEGVAVFQARLPRGAQLKTLSAQSPAAEWAGRKISADAYAKLSAASYLSLTRDRLLVTYGPDGDVSTSPLPGLQPGDAVVVQYAYTLKAGSPEKDESLVLPLYQPDQLNGLRAPASADLISTASPSRPNTQASVWVEWVGDKPLHVHAIPRDASIELDAQRAGAIAGLSWTSTALQPGDQFRLAWLM